MLNFCTLFDINFATQGVAMYESLKEHCDDFHLYIFAFCDDCYALLKQLNLKHVTVISLNEFENKDEELLKIKETRTRGEYCWTCSSSTIKYCLEKFNLDSCTYIDADLYFYSNPKVLVDEMGDKSVLITEHRYTPEFDQTETSGKYCVQFITFKNNEAGLNVLNWWRNACLEWCYARFEDGKFGDQKYLDDWTQRFDCVHVLEHLGGGVAPWNIHQYDIFKEGKQYKLKEKSTQKIFDLVFYHFHSVKIQENGTIDTNKYDFYDTGIRVWNLIYVPYLKHLSTLSKNLHKIIEKIILVQFSIFNTKLFKRKIKNLRKFIFSFRFSKNGRFLKILGVYIIKPKQL